MVETCSTLGVIVTALAPVALAAVTGVLALLSRRTKQTARSVAEVVEKQATVDDLVAWLKGRPNGG